MAKWLLIDWMDGQPFGTGDTQAECITNAAQDGFHGENVTEPCTEEWVRAQIMKGFLIFEKDEEEHTT